MKFQNTEIKELTLKADQRQSSTQSEQIKKVSEKTDIRREEISRVMVREITEAQPHTSHKEKPA